MLRAVSAAVAMETNSRMMRVLVAGADVLQDLDADDDGADGPRRDAEEEAHVRVLGDEDQEHRQLDGLEAGDADVEEHAEDARDDGQQQRAGRRSGSRPTMPSTSRPKYQKMASVMTTQMRRPRWRSAR